MEDHLEVELPNDGPSHPKSPPTIQRGEIMAILVFAAGAIVWGTGAAVSRAKGWEQSPWALSMLLSLVIGGILLRHHGKHLLWIIPAAWIGISVSVTMVELSAQPIVNDIVQRSSCDEADEFMAGLSDITTDIQAWNNDFTKIVSPTSANYRNWSDTWKRISQRYQDLPEMDGSEKYVSASIRGADFYSTGFKQHSVGDFYGGESTLVQGDSAIDEARRHFPTIRVPVCD